MSFSSPGSCKRYNHNSHGMAMVLVLQNFYVSCHGSEEREIDLAFAKELLDSDHCDLSKVKKQIILSVGVSKISTYLVFCNFKRIFSKNQTASHLE